MGVAARRVEERALMGEEGVALRWVEGQEFPLVRPLRVQRLGGWPGDVARDPCIGKVVVLCLFSCDLRSAVAGC